MQKREFINELMAHLTKYGYKPRLTRSEKLNYSNQKIIILEGEKLRPIIYIEPLFKDFLRGKSMDDIFKEIELSFLEKNRVLEIVNINSLDKWEEVKRLIYCRVFSKSPNDALLMQEKIPYYTFLDLVITFYIQFHNECISVPVTCDFLKIWGITKDEILDAAMRNSESDWFNIKGISSMLPNVIEENADVTLEDDIMYILSNKTGQYGASGIINKEILERAYYLFKEKNYYILPSSIHELILMPDDKYIDEFELKEIVREVNETIVQPFERLSYSVYYYNHESREVKIIA